MTPEALAALHARCFIAPPPWSAAAFAGLLQAPGVFLCTAPAGFALGRAVAGEAELLTIAVAPESRRQGAGRALLAAFEAEARTRGAQSAFAEVAVSNIAARALYAAAGYGDVGLRAGYCRGPDGHAQDAVLLARSLAAVQPCDSPAKP